MPRKSVGTVTRLPPDFYWRRMMGGVMAVTGAGANLTYVGLNNNASAGANLWVCGFSFTTGASANCVMEIENQQPFLALGNQNSLWSLQRPSYGVIGSQKSPACFGKEIGQIGPIFGWGYWPYEWPCAILAPGYTFWLHTSAAAVDLTASFWWYEMDGDE